jgi:hypothetical protein
MFRIFGGFLHIPTTQIYCLTGVIISETHIIIIIITIHNTKYSIIVAEEVKGQCHILMIKLQFSTSPL